MRDPEQGLLAMLGQLEAGQGLWSWATGPRWAWEIPRLGDGPPAASLCLPLSACLSLALVTPSGFCSSSSLQTRLRPRRPLSWPSSSLSVGSGLPFPVLPVPCPLLTSSLSTGGCVGAESSCGCLASSSRRLGHPAWDCEASGACWSLYSPQWPSPPVLCAPHKPRPHKCLSSSSAAQGAPLGSCHFPRGICVLVPVLQLVSCWVPGVPGSAFSPCWGQQQGALGLTGLPAPRTWRVGSRLVAVLWPQRDSSWRRGVSGLTAVAICLQVPEIVSVLRSKLQETREEYILQAAQHSVYLLASQHRTAVVSSLLGSPLPFDRYPVPASLLGWTGRCLPLHPSSSAWEPARPRGLGWEGDRPWPGVAVPTLSGPSAAQQALCRPPVSVGALGWLSQALPCTLQSLFSVGCRIICKRTPRPGPIFEPGKGPRPPCTACSPAHTPSS